MPKFTHQNPKGFAYGRGPVDLHNTSLYTKKLENYLNQAVYESQNDPHIFASHVENFFRESMAKKYTQVDKMRQELENVRAENMRKAQIVKNNKNLVDQRHMSKVLV